MKKFTVMALVMMVLSMGTVFAQNRGGNHNDYNNGRPRVEQRAPGKYNDKNKKHNDKKGHKHNDHHYAAPRPHASHHAPVVHHDCHACTPHHVCAAHRPVIHRAPRPVVHTSTHRHDCGNTAAIAGAAVVTGMVLGAIMASN